MTDTSHVMDKFPARFGWRYWHVDETGTRLLSPIHRGRLRFGRRFAESDCPHRRDGHPFVLSEDCHCGIHYVPAVDYFLGIENEITDRARTVITFGAAIGGTAPDPALPEDARRTVRYVIHALLVYENSCAAASLRTRFGVSATMRAGSRQAFDDIEAVVRAELTGMTAAEVFNTPMREPILDIAEHVCDTNPDQFGWRQWILTADGHLSDGRLTYAQPATPPADGQRAFFEAKCPHGNTVPSPACDCGIAYYPSVTGCRRGLDDLAATAAASGADIPVAVTFGFAGGRTALGRWAQDGSPNGWIRRTRRYSPLALCIPESHAHLASAVRRNYPDLPVTTSTTIIGMIDAEQTARRQLLDATAADLLR